MLHLMNKGFMCWVSLVAGLLMVAPAIAAETIRINGTGSGLHMMKPLIATYTKAHSDVRIETDKALGSSGSIKALLAGALDIAISSRKLKPEETQHGAILTPYGQTPLALVTHKDVTQKNISTQELVNIFTGKTLNWPDGNPIRLILRPHEDSDTKILRQLSPEMDAALTIAQERPGMTIAVTDPEAIAAIAKTPGALGASGLTGVMVEQLPINVMSLNGVEPTPETIKKGEFPLIKSLDIITLNTVPQAAKHFLAFLFSPEGKAIAKTAGVQITAGEASPW